MNKIVRIFYLTAACLCALPSNAQWRREPTPADTLQSVRRLDDGSVVFSIYAPDADRVSLAGDVVPFGGRGSEVRKNPDGVWNIILRDVKDGVYRYHFVVDGNNVYDPKSELAGETSALARIQSDGDSYYAMKDVPHGSLSQRWYWSSTLNTWRRMHVWTPAGYEKSKKKLPVLYLIHGGGDTDNSWPGVGCANLILDNLLAQGKMVPMIVVMPNGTINGVPDEVPPFAQDMVTDIIPYIENNYRVAADKGHRAIAGLSMGGMETLEVALNNIDMFSYVWVLSSSLKPGADPAAEAERLHVGANADRINKTFREFVFTQGGPTDIAYRNGQNTRAEFEKLGVEFKYEENAQDGHSWATWRADLYDLAQRLFR